mmetsp:Transcript_14198/g.16624  ORF Transcript_14198/g.16624 Transcript_14198/m.16624 type:complete len:336 (+) Transcript_14198:196-1203(+)
MNIVTYNIHSGIGLDNNYDVQRIADVIRKSGADVACLQEIEVNKVERKARKWSAVHSDNQPEKIAELCDMPYVAFLPCISAYMEEGTSSSELKVPFWKKIVGRAELLQLDEEKKSSYGLAILSKFKILEIEDFMFSRNTEHRGDVINMDKEEQPRGAIAILVEVPDESSGEAKHVWVVNTHLCHKFGTYEQRRQAGELDAWIKKLLATKSYGEILLEDCGVVLCGDMNSPEIFPKTGVSTLVTNGWKDLWKSKGTFSKSATMPSSVYTSERSYLTNIMPYIGMRIDYIMSTKRPKGIEVRCDKIEVLSDKKDAVASDHCAVIAQLSLHTYSPLQI